MPLAALLLPMVLAVSSLPPLRESLAKRLLLDL
jgi:hypothetical protein